MLQKRTILLHSKTVDDSSAGSIYDVFGNRICSEVGLRSQSELSLFFMNYASEAGVFGFSKSLPYMGVAYYAIIIAASVYFSA